MSCENCAGKLTGPELALMGQMVQILTDRCGIKGSIGVVEGFLVSREDSVVVIVNGNRYRFAQSEIVIV